MEDKKLDLYLRVLNQFPNPIWRAGLDGKCDFFNQAWLDFTGRTVEQEMGNGWTEGVHPDDLKPCVDDYLKNFAAQKSFLLEYRLRYNDGTYHWLLDYGSPFYDDDGKFLGYIGSCYDNDATKRHQMEVEEMNSMMTDRELKMIALKKRIAELEGETK